MEGAVRGREGKVQAVMILSFIIWKALFARIEMNGIVVLTNWREREKKKKKRSAEIFFSSHFVVEEEEEERKKMRFDARDAFQRALSLSFFLAFCSFYASSRGE